MEISLQAWSTSLIPELVEACNDPDIQARLPVPHPYLEKHAEYFINSVVPSFEKDGGGNFAVLLPNGALGGCVSVRSLNATSARLGYWVAPDARGKGIAAKAATAAAEWALTRQFETLLLTIGVDNPASQKVAVKAGFSQVGHKSNYEISPGMFKDTLLFERSVGKTRGIWPIH